MCSFDASHGSVYIVNALIGVGVAEVVLIEHREEPVGADGVLCQDGGPIAFVLLFSGLVVDAGEEGLQFGAQAVAFFDADLCFEHVDVGVDDALEIGRDWRGQRVEVKVEEGVLGLEAFREFPADVEVDVADVELASGPPAVALVSVHSTLQVGQVGGVEAARGGVLEADFGAVLPAKLAFSRDGVEHLGRPTHLTLYNRGIGVKCGGEVVGVLFGDGGDVVDGHVEELQVPVRAELHVVDPFEADVDAQPFCGPSGVHEDALSTLVDVPIVRVGVVDFAHVFTHELESAPLELCAVAPRPDVVGELEVEGVLGDGAAGLEPADEAAAQCDSGAGGGESLDSIVEVDLCIDGPDGTGTIDQARVEIKALLADESLEGDAVCRAKDEPEAVEGIVDAQLPFLVSPQQESRSELLVEVAEGDVEILFGIVGVAVAYARAPKPARITEDGVEIALVPHAG